MELKEAYQWLSDSYLDVRESGYFKRVHSKISPQKRSNFVSHISNEFFKITMDGNLERLRNMLFDFEVVGTEALAFIDSMALLENMIEISRQPTEERTPESCLFNLTESMKRKFYRAYEEIFLSDEKD